MLSTTAGPRSLMLNYSTDKFFRCRDLSPGPLSGKRQRYLWSIQPLLLPRGLLAFLLGGEEHRFRSHRHRNIVASGHWSNNNWKLSNAENWLNYVRHNTSLILKRPFETRIETLSIFFNSIFVLFRQVQSFSRRKTTSNVNISKLLLGGKNDGFVVHYYSSGKGSLLKRLASFEQRQK